MWNMADAERISSAWYFAILLVISAYFLLNVFIAGISSIFLRLRRENQVHPDPLRLPHIPSSWAQNNTALLLGMMLVCTFCTFCTWKLPFCICRHRLRHAVTCLPKLEASASRDVLLHTI